MSLDSTHARVLDAKDLPELEPLLRRLPQFSIDHFGLTASSTPSEL